MNNTESRKLVYASWEIDFTENKLVHAEQSTIIIIPDKPMRLLEYLLKKPNQLVEREELVQQIWQGNHYVGVRAITDAVWKLRKLLEPIHPLQIQTIPKKGYKLVMDPTLLQDSGQNPVRTSVGSDSQSAPAPEAVNAKATRNRLVQGHYWLIAFLFLLFLFSFPYWQKLFFRNQLNRQLPSVKSITYYPGAETMPYPSPDDYLLAFVWEHQGLTGVFVQPLEQKSSGQKRPVRNMAKTDQGVIKEIAWSPDGVWLAFLEQDKDLNCSIRMVRIEDAQEQYIDDCLGNILPSLSWSPDGRYLTYLDTMDGGEGLILYQVADKKKTMLLAFDEGVYFDAYPSWSPDSEHLAFVRSISHQRQNIWITDLNGKSSQLTDEMQRIHGLDYSPDGRSLVYSSDRQGTVSLWRLSVQDMKSEPLENSQNIVQPRFSRSGKLYATHSRQELHIARYAKNSHALTPLVQSVANDKYPHFSGKRSQLIFQSERDGERGLWIADEHGNQVERLLGEVKDVYFATWSPDGQKIAYISTTSAGQYLQLWVYDLMTRTRQQVSFESFDHLGVTWSYDGRYLFSNAPQSGQREIWRYSLSDYSLSDSQSERFTDDNALSLMFAEDDKSYYYFSGFDDSIKKKTTASQRPEILITGLYHKDWANWVLTEDGIYFVKREVTADRICFYDFTSQTYRVEKELPPRSIYYSRSMVRFSDDDHLLLTVAGKLEADIVLLN